MPETVLMMSSTGLVTEVSISSTPAPCKTVVIVQTGKSTLGKRSTPKPAISDRAQDDRDRHEDPGKHRPLDADVRDRHGMVPKKEMSGRRACATRRFDMEKPNGVLHTPYDSIHPVKSVLQRSFDVRRCCGFRRLANLDQGAVGQRRLPRDDHLTSRRQVSRNFDPVLAFQTGRHRDGSGLVPLDDEDLGHTGELDDGLQRNNRRLALLGW